MHSPDQVLATAGHHSLVELHLHTGRTHQLRVHLAASQHPIIGDPLYDPLASRAPRLLLHATALQLVTPFAGEDVRVNAPLPAIFNDLEQLQTY